jgi:hypothetical protein
MSTPSTCKVCFAAVPAGSEADHDQWHAYIERRLVAAETALNSLGAGN